MRSRSAAAAGDEAERSNLLPEIENVDEFITNYLKKKVLKTLPRAMATVGVFGALVLGNLAGRHKIPDLASLEPSRVNELLVSISNFSSEPKHLKMIYEMKKEQVNASAALADVLREGVQQMQQGVDSSLENSVEKFEENMNRLAIAQ